MRAEAGATRLGDVADQLLALDREQVRALDVSIDTPQWGKVTMDISYGGIFYALVDVRQIGLTIEKANAAKLVSAGMILKDLVNREMTVVHPEIPAISGVAPYGVPRSTAPRSEARVCDPR